MKRGVIIKILFLAFTKLYSDVYSSIFNVIYSRLLIYMCDVCHAGWQCVAPAAIRFRRCRPSTDGTVLTGTNRKEDSPVKMARRVIELTLMGCDGVFRGVDASWMLTIITTQSNTLEGSRLQKRGCISTSILACMSTLSIQSNSEPKWTPSPRSGPRMAKHGAFYRENLWHHG